MSPEIEALVVLGYSGRHIAEVVDVSAPTISLWRHGRVHVSTENRAKLAVALRTAITHAIRNAAPGDVVMGAKIKAAMEILQSLESH